MHKPIHILHNNKAIMLLLILVQTCLCSSATQHNYADTTILQGKFKAIDALWESNEFLAVAKLSHELIDSSVATNDLNGKAWGKYYLSMAHNQLDNIDSSIFYAKSAYTDFTRTNDYYGQAQSLSSLGATYHFIPLYDSSTIILNKAVNIILTKIKDSSLLIAPYNVLGENYTNLADHDKALDYLLKSLQIAQKVNDKNKEAQILNNIGILLGQKGDINNAFEFYFKSLAIYTEANNTKGVAYQHNNIGIILTRLGDYTNALEHLKKSLALKNSLNDRRGISNTLLNIGRLYMENNRYDNAIAYLEQSETIKEQIKDYSGLASIYMFKGQTYQKMGLYDKSLQFLNLAVQTYQPTKETKSIENAMIQQAITYCKMQQYNKALQILNRVDEENNGTNPDISGQVYNTYFEIYNSQNNCTLALLYYKKYIDIRDSISSIENLKKILSLQMRLDYEDIIKLHKKQNSIQLKEANDSNIRNAKLADIFITAFCSVTILLILLVYTIRNKQKANIKLGIKQVEIENQKQELINQRDDLQIQKDLVIYQRDKIVNMLTDLGESINYARLIQQATLPSDKTMLSFFANYFVINQPKESVGGDFYWAGITNTKHIIFVAADSTGHGVPGGFMSMLCLSMIAEIVARNICETPADALEELRRNIITTLGQHGDDDDNPDGMDLAFCAYHPQTKKLYYAGANLSIIISTKQNLPVNDKICSCGNNLYEIKPDRMPISYYDPMSSFSNVEVQLDSNDIIYLFSDGYVDQFGGLMDKKFGHTAFRNLLHSVKDLPLGQQKQVLWTTIEKWKGEMGNQTDDILLMGLQLK